MSDRKQEILDSILNGRWVIQNLAPVFHKKLAEASFKHAVWPGSLNGLSLMYYGHVASPNELDGLDTERFLTTGNKSAKLFAKLIGEVFEESATLGNFAEGEREAIEAAGANLKKVWSEFSAPFEQITLFVRGTGATVLGASFPHTFGTIYYGDNLTRVDSGALSVSLAHEVAHHELFLINLYDRLIEPQADNSLHYAPLQKKSRPPIGRLHAFYALFRMVQAKRRLGLDYQNDLEIIDSARKSLRDDELTSYAQTLADNIMDHTHSR